jgi:TRAP-type C4-dicarboxylate transport system substrate-binding protein
MSRLLIVLCILLCAVAAPSASAKTLKIATMSPDGTSWMKEMRKGAQEIRKQTQGRVRIKFYPGGVMGSDKSTLRKIRIGQLHGTALMGSGLAMIYSNAHIYGLPLTFHSYEEADYVRERLDPLVMAELEEQGFVGFGIAEAGFSYLMSNQPVRSIEDLRRQKMWIPEGDRVSHVAMETMGVAAVPLPLSDVLTGLQTGLIDAAAGSPIGHIAFQWYTRTRFFTDTPLLYIYGILVISRQEFATLSPPDQATIREIMGDVFHRLNRQTRLDNARARKALQRQGITFVDLPPEDLRQWRQAAGEAVRRLSRDGVVSPVLLETLNRHLREYRRLADASK